MCARIRAEIHQMAAVLERNNLSGKPTVLPDGMANSELVKCDSGACQISYTLAYGAVEIRMQDGVLVPDVMRRKAIQILADSHPSHPVEMYVWGGIEKGWLDREQARAAGL